MNKYLLVIPLFLLLQGCTPKIGKDIFISINDNDVKIESSKVELTMTALSFVGLPFDKKPVKLSGFLTVENKWWKSINVKSINYVLLQNDEQIASGRADINKHIEIDSEVKRKIPLSLIIDSKTITPTKMIKRLSNSDVMEISGTVVVEVFGKEISTDFKNKINNKL